MLNENEVVAAVCGYLKNNGYATIKFRETTERGIDIIAEHSSRPERLLIEAKGGTSARPGSRRHGRDYDPNQVFDRVAKGFYTAATLNVLTARMAIRSVSHFPTALSFGSTLIP